MSRIVHVDAACDEITGNLPRTHAGWQAMSEMLTEHVLSYELTEGQFYYRRTDIARFIGLELDRIDIREGRGKRQWET